MTAARFLLTSFPLLCLIPVGRSVHAQDAKKMDKRDTQALSRMARADMAEIAARKLAAQKASSDEVQKFGSTWSTITARCSTRVSRSRSRRA